MNKFTDFMQNKVIKNKKAKIVYLSLMGTAFAIFAVFLILFILSAAAPRVYFTDRDTWDKLTGYIKSNVDYDDGVYDDSINVSTYSVNFTYTVPPKGSSSNYEYFLAKIKLGNDLYVYYHFDLGKTSYKFNVRVKYNGRYNSLDNTYRVKTDGLELLYGDESDSGRKNLARTAIKSADYILSQGLRRLDSDLYFDELKEELASFTQKADGIFVASLVLFIIFLPVGIAMLALFLIFKRKAKNAPQTAEPSQPTPYALPDEQNENNTQRESAGSEPAQAAAFESAFIRSVSHVECEEQDEGNEPNEPQEPPAAPAPEATEPPAEKAAPEAAKKSKTEKTPESGGDYKYCMFCGAKLKSVARFCTKCGSKLDD